MIDQYEETCIAHYEAVGKLELVYRGEVEDGDLVAWCII